MRPITLAVALSTARGAALDGRRSLRRPKDGLSSCETHHTCDDTMGFAVAR